MPFLDRIFAFLENTTNALVNPGDAANQALRVNMVASSAASSTQYTEGDTDTTITGTAIVFESDTSTSTLSTVNATTPLPVVASKQGAVTNRSGSLTLGGTAQQMMAANSSRRYLLIQNISSGDLWFNFTTTAVQDQPSIKLESGSGFVQEAEFISTELISVIGATTGQKWVAKEG